MKRLSLIKKIALGVGALASVTPIALMATSCAVTSFKADFVDFNSIRDNANYSKAQTNNVPFRKILYGSKKIYGGNYVVFVGSNMFDDAREFFAASGKITRQQWFKTSEEAVDGFFDKGRFYTGIKDSIGVAMKNFGIYNCIDFFNGEVYDKKGHIIYISDKDGKVTDKIGPWDVWTDPIIQQTKQFNKDKAPQKYDWDETSVKKDEYIRNDESAQQLRALCKEGLTIFPTTEKRKTSFDVSNNNKYSKMVIFKDGKLVDITALPTSSDAWKDIIQKNFKDSEEK